MIKPSKKPPEVPPSKFSGQEIWKVVEEFPAYDVSSHGRVRRGSLVRKLSADKKGYLSVVLWDGDRHKKFSIGRLVAAVFIGNRPDGCVVRHRNGDNSTNNVENLCYGTPSENEADKIEHGTRLAGEKHHQSKLTMEQVAEIRQRYKPGCPVNGGLILAAEFKVSGPLISNIVHRKIWANF